MSVIDELVVNSQRYREAFTPNATSPAPSRRVAVLACMDARIDPIRLLGLVEGDAHVIRNAGGIATVDTIRSLLISQRMLGTEEIMLIHHTDCGMENFTDDALKNEILEETGLRPDFALEAFKDTEADVRQTAARIMASPFIPHKRVRGFVYEVETGLLREVALG